MELRIIKRVERWRCPTGEQENESVPEEGEEISADLPMIAMPNWSSLHRADYSGNSCFISGVCSKSSTSWNANAPTNKSGCSSKVSKDSCGSL